MVAAVGHRLHAAGVPVTPERSGRFATALALGRSATVDEAYWAGRVTLLSGPEQIATYDAVFAEVFRGHRRRRRLARARPRRRSRTRTTGRLRRARARPPRPARGGRRRRGRAAAPAGHARRRRRGPPAGARTCSPRPAPDERLGHTDLADLTADELADLRRLLAARPWTTPPRASRRTVRHPRGRELDLRASLRRARATGGDPVRRAYRHRRRRPRRLVLLADVSGSMAPYARAYLHLLHGAVRASRAEAFVFATRLTRLTRALAAATPEVALARATEAAPDWSGGTRIGAALATFLDDFGRRGMARGAVVVIVSDGWDTGDPAAVGEQMARLARLAHRVVWVNPRSAAPGYAPLVAGMAAALPHIDTLVSGHSVAALDEVFAAVAAPDP